jgi:hypothetical protein
MSSQANSPDTRVGARHTQTGRTSDSATTRSPADRDLFGDESATQPTKDKKGDPPRRSTEAGGVD